MVLRDPYRMPGMNLGRPPDSGMLMLWPRMLKCLNSLSAGGCCPGQFRYKHMLNVGLDLPQHRTGLRKEIGGSVFYHNRDRKNQARQLSSHTQHCSRAQYTEPINLVPRELLDPPLLPSSQATSEWLC